MIGLQDSHANTLESESLATGGIPNGAKPHSRSCQPAQRRVERQVRCPGASSRSAPGSCQTTFGSDLSSCLVECSTRPGNHPSTRNAAMAATIGFIGLG